MRLSGILQLSLTRVATDNKLPPLRLLEFVQFQLHLALAGGGIVPLCRTLVRGRDVVALVSDDLATRLGSTFRNGELDACRVGAAVHLR